MTAIVTGGCGLIGKSFVRALAANGKDVVAVDIDQKEGKQLANESTNISYVHCDVTDTKSFDQAISNVQKAYGQIDAIIHSAYPRTSSWGTPFEELDAREVARNLDLQLGSAIMVSQKAVAHFRGHGGGHLIHISSIQGISAPKFEHYEETEMTSPVEYTAVKHGIIGLTKYLAKYLSGTNIRVNCISPGGVRDGQPESFQSRYDADCTSKGLLDPEDVAGPLLFLLSDNAKYVNGQNIMVDDGWSL